MDNNHTLSGVSCSVSSCAYHCADNSCAAHGIEVHQDGAEPTSCQETLCSTFKNISEGNSQQQQ